MQLNDKKIYEIIERITNGSQKDDKFVVNSDILFRIKESNDKISYRLVVPQTLIDTVMRICHDDMSGGHLGFKKTWPKIRDRFYWKTMYADTKKWLQSCSKCAERKSPQPSKSEQHPITKITKPFEMVGVYILGPLPETPRNNK